MIQWLKKHWEVLSYLIFGVLTTLLNILLYALFNRLFGYTAANSWGNVLDNILCILFAYATNRAFVFRSKTRGREQAKEFTAFVSCRLGTMLLDTVIVLVLGNLLGEGDPKFAAEVKIPLRPELVMYGGLCAASAQETEIIKRLQLRKATAAELAVDSAPILEWLHANQIERLAIHLDLDVLDPRFFRALLFAQPDGTVIDAPHGEMTLQQIARIIGDISRETDVVGLAIAEHLPWDALNLHNFLAELPILKR